MQSSAPFCNSPTPLMSFQSVNMAVVAFCLVIPLWLIFPISRFIQLKSLHTCSSSIVLTGSQRGVCKYDIQLSGLPAANLMNQPRWGVPQGQSGNTPKSVCLHRSQTGGGNLSRTFDTEGNAGKRLWTGTQLVTGRSQNPSERQKQEWRIVFLSNVMKFIINTEI